MSTDSDTASAPLPFTPRSPDGGTDPAGPLRVVLLGAGAMARHHATAIQRLGPSARIVGVADPSPEALVPWAGWRRARCWRATPPGC
jgi:hypothetical protein